MLLTDFLSRIVCQEITVPFSLMMRVEDTTTTSTIYIDTPSNLQMFHQTLPQQMKNSRYHHFICILIKDCTQMLILSVLL